MNPPSLDQMTLDAIQSAYGSVDPNSLVTRRRQYYSFVQYLAAGQQTTSFFGTSQGGTNKQLTNLMTPGQLDYPFIVKSLRMAYYINNPFAAAWDGTDATTLFSDLANGLFQCGILRISIGGQEKLVLPSPFLYAPPGAGSRIYRTNGTLSAVGTTASGSNPVAVSSVIIGPPPMADLCGRKERAYVVDPYYMLQKQQSFQFTLEYPYGVVPVIATSVVNDSTNPLYVGLYIDGLEIQNMQ